MKKSGIAHPWQTYPNKLKILLNVYGSQEETDDKMIAFYESFSEAKITRDKEINAKLQNSARGYYPLECSRTNRNIKHSSTSPPDMVTEEPGKKTINTSKVKFCCSTEYTPS